ncbi:MAG TPA: UDP-N-acetylmuramoyl-L-alanyl-D-glutamate--2,6-diaminopimelate ligase [Armatimonadaceae bacterium]|nr:UDP-N-acetylmuramoyl-L-alanyl-D-glutamate--2,6-diaminopimelate ligase [Armatimonadaceae bacterium]
MRTVDDVVRSLGELADAVAGATLVGDAATAVTGVTYDSRQVAPGTLFLAVPGEKFDGHDFVAAAVQAGAAAVAVQADRAANFADLSAPRLIVPDVRRAMPLLASAFWGEPTRSLYLAGVTGTNGKTTTALMIDAIARAAGDVTGYVGTLGATVAGQELPGERTTPESPDLQALFARMLAAGAKSAAIEVASHALALGRTDGCAFDVGVFTNLTQDHLDFHGTMEAYRDAKAILFTDYADAARAAGKRFVAVLNADDPAGRRYRDVTRAERVVLYSPSGDAAGADIIPQDVRLAVDSIAFTVKTPSGSVPVRLGFGGTFNVANALAAIGYGVARGLPLETVARGLAQCPPVPGRFQPVQAGQPYAVLVDYAHTPDGIENVLRSARPLTPGRLVVVFGCGGNRDRTKRPKMGRLAMELADVAVVTSDNPRREEPEAIIDGILTGMQGAGAEVRRESDRRKAIGLAVSLARPGDTVVIAGKGHETYQIVGDQTYPFDDVAVAGEEIRRCSGAA